MISWSMVIHVDHESGDVTLETPSTGTAKHVRAERRVVLKSELKTTFHVYDLDKFSHFLTFDEGFVFHTWFRLKTPRVIRMLAVCVRHGHGFSCMLANADDVRRSRHRTNSSEDGVLIDPRVFALMPEGTDIKRIEDATARVITADIIH